jgi:hypothetical protein
MPKVGRWMEISAYTCCNPTTTLTTTLVPRLCETLGNAANFVVLGASTVTNTGTSVITGDLGLYPGTSVTGFPPGLVYGTQYIANTMANLAKISAQAAFDCLMALTRPTRLGADIGGTTITPGVYDFASSAAITGTVILDGGGDPNAVFVFQIPSTLITATSAIVSLIGSAQAGNVYWLVGSSATLGTSTTMVGNIIASQSITMNTSATLNGRAFALVAAVTLDTNTIIAHDCSINPCSTTTTTTVTPTTTSTTTESLTTTTTTGTPTTTTTTTEVPVTTTTTTT